MNPDPKSQPTEAVILSELALVFEPVGDAAKQASQGNQQAVDELLADIGLDETAVGSNYDALVSELEGLAGPWNTLQTEIVDPLSQGNSVDLTALDDLFTALRDLFDIIRGLDDISLETPDIERAGELVLDYLLITYLHEHYPGVHSVCSLLGVIKMEGPGTAGTLDLSAFGNVFAAPGEYADDLLSWGTEEFEPYIVLFYVEGIVRQFGMDGSFEDVSNYLANGLPSTEEMAKRVARELLDALFAEVDVSADVEQLATEVATDVANDITAGQTPDPEALLTTVTEKTATKLDDELAQELADELGDVPDADALTDRLRVGQPLPLVQNRKLCVNVLSLTGASGTAGIALVPLPGKNSKLPGLAVEPCGAINADHSQQLSGNWTFNAEVSGDADWTLELRPQSGGGTSGAVFDTDGTELDAEAFGEVALAYESSDDEVTPILGDPEGTGVGIRYFEARVTVEYDGESAVVAVELPVRGRVQVQPDGPFLEKVMPDEIGYDFDATFGWASDVGFYFERGGSLEVSLAQDTSLGPLSMEEVYASLEPDADSAGGGAGSGGGPGAGGTGGADSSGSSTGGSGSTGGGSTGGGDGSLTSTGDVDVRQGKILIQGAVSGSAELGPFTATVRRIGVQGAVSFPEDGGNLGPADLDIAFKPPEGVGLSIDAGAVSGGGYLELDPENDRYAGILQLKTGDLTINAVGLLTTELPGGDDGFSLLLMISGEFPPVQLGMGFTLNGVGGLVGINRTFKSDPLGNAVREGSMDSILFPEDPIANSQRIISDLRAIFPPTAGTHVFGPIVRLGWGTPTLITADVGVLLEVPSFRIALLGRLSAVLPDDVAPLVELNLAVTGVLDPPNKQLSIDASLYDSRVVAWSLSGDMALRSRWGDNPRFVLSVGGFNPRFDPPSDFPELDRVRASLGPPGGNPKLEYYGYFALTSNTVQAGAGVHLRARAGPAKVEGRLQFDALIQFDPFGFVVDILASLSVTIKGKGLSITLDGTLKGPGPFEISGTITIEILFISVTADVDVTIGSGGDDEELPPAKILPELTDALGKPANWAAGRPGAASNMVTLRDPTSDGKSDDKTVLAHPLADIGVRQTVVPLAFELETYGNARPTGLTRFTIDSAEVGGETALSLGAQTKEQFAPAQYHKMSDGEKLDSEAFRPEVAGQRMRHEGIYVGADSPKNVRPAELVFESAIIDETNDNRGKPLSELGQFDSAGLSALSGMESGVIESLANASAVADSPLRTSGVEQFRGDDGLTVQRGQGNDIALNIVGGMSAGVSAGLGQNAPVGDATGDVAGDGASVVAGAGGDGGYAGGSRMLAGTSQYVIASKATLEVVDIPTADDQPLSKAEATRALSVYAESHPPRADELQVVEASRARGDPQRGESGQSAVGQSTPETDTIEFAFEEGGQRYIGGNQ